MVKERTAELRDLNENLKIQNNIFALAEQVAQIGSYTVYMQTRKMAYSNNLFRMFGYEPQEFVPSFEKFVSFIHPDDREQVIKINEEAFKTRMMVEAMYRIITKKGEVKYCSSTGNFMGENENQMLVGNVHDITKDIRMNEDLQLKNIELERSNAELSSFSYVASHDLQEPLRKIQTFTSRILEKEEPILSDTGKEYFSRIVTASQRMQKLIEALLSYSRTNASTSTFVPVNLNEVLAEARQNLFDVIEEKNVVIESDDLPTLPGITLQIHQLFINLIGNAVKYSKPGATPFIKITCSSVFARR